MRNNLRLSGAELHLVFDADHAGEERHGAEAEAMSNSSSLNACSMGEGNKGVGVGARGWCQGVFPLAWDGPFECPQDRLREPQGDRNRESRLRCVGGVGVAYLGGSDAALPGARSPFENLRTGFEFPQCERAPPRLFAYADVMGIGGGASATGAAGVDGVGVGAGGREQELDRRCLRHLRDGSRLRRNGALGQEG